MEPFVGEIRLFAFARIPTGWLACNSAILQVQQYMALFSLLGIRYGGNGTTTFALPDLRGRVPIHFSAALPQGTAGGQESVPLTVAQMPSHNHTVQAYSTAGNVAGINDNWPALGTRPTSASTAPAAPNLYGPASNLTAIDPSSMNATGGGAAHENRQPLMALNYCIAWQGLFPPRQ